MIFARNLFCLVETTNCSDRFFSCTLIYYCHLAFYVFEIIITEPMPDRLLKPKQGERVNKSERDIFFMLTWYLTTVTEKIKFLHGMTNICAFREQKNWLALWCGRAKLAIFDCLFFVRANIQYPLLIVMLRHGDIVSYSNIWMENRGSEKYIFRFHEIKKSINWKKKPFFSLKIELKKNGFIINVAILFDAFDIRHIETGRKRVDYYSLVSHKPKHILYLYFYF